MTKPYDIDKLKQAIGQLESLNENDDLAYEKAFLIFQSIDKLPVFIKAFPPGTVIFRTRTHEDDKLYIKCSEIGVTPKKVISKYARCNRPFQSMFYCSENRETSYMELIEYWVETKQIGDKIGVTIGRWKIINPLNVIIIVSPDKSKRVSKYDKVHGAAFDELLQGRPQDELDYINELYRYLFEKFRKPAKNDVKTYIITTAYSNLALCQAEGKAAGLSYPSVPYNGEGVNFAISQDFVNTSLILTDVLWTEFEVRPTDDGHYNFMDVNRKHTNRMNYSTDEIKW